MAQVVWNADIDVYDNKVIPVTVARSMSQFLDIPDLLSFSLVSRNAHKAVKDPALWVLKLQKMGVWDETGSSSTMIPSEYEFESLENPLECLTKICKVRKLARYHMLNIWRSLKDYYSDLQSNVAYNKLKIFTNFSDPKDQGRLLSNMLRYNTIDPNDNTRMLVRQKITDLIEIFENALLRELEIHYDMKDFENTKKFVAIMIELKNEQTLIDFFLQKSCFDNEAVKFLNSETFNAGEFFSDNQKLHNGVSEVDLEHLSLNHEAIISFINELATVFNALSQSIDLLIPPTIPVMYRVCEELITNQLHDILSSLVSSSRKKGLYLEFVPSLYTFLLRDFIDKLDSCENMGVNYHNIVHQLLDVSYEYFVPEYLNEERSVYRDFCSKRITLWKTKFIEREIETIQSIKKNVKTQSKKTF